MQRFLRETNPSVLATNTGVLDRSLHKRQAAAVECDAGDSPELRYSTNTPNLSSGINEDVAYGSVNPLNGFTKR